MKTNHWLIVLGVTGVIVAIWAALRKTGVSTPVIIQQSPSLQPMYGVQGVTPIGAPAVSATAAPANPSAVQAQVPGTSASGVPNYSAQTQLTAGGAPIPGPLSGSLPKFYGPIQQFLASMVPNTDYAPAPKSSCGCGGGCSGADSCKDPCAATNSRFPDGRGACLAFNRKTQIASANPMVFMRASANVQSANINSFDVFEQTVTDHMARADNVPPASPFLTPV